MTDKRFTDLMVTIRIIVFFVLIGFLGNLLLRQRRMTDKEKIIVEIERLRNKNYNSCDEDQCYGYDCCLDDLLKFIDSLPEEPVRGSFVFKAIPRLLDMIESTERARSYTAKLADTLESEGYPTDANIVRECIKRMNGEKVAMATMDKEPVSEKDKLRALSDGKQHLGWLDDANAMENDHDQ